MISLCLVETSLAREFTHEMVSHHVEICHVIMTSTSSVFSTTNMVWPESISQFQYAKTISMVLTTTHLLPCYLLVDRARHKQALIVPWALHLSMRLTIATSNRFMRSLRQQSPALWNYGLWRTCACCGP